MGHGTHVGSRGYAGAEAGAVGFDGEDVEFLDLDLDWLQDYLFLFSCQFVGRDAVDFFGGEWRRDLLDYAEKSGGELLELIQAWRVDRRMQRSPNGLAIGVVGVGGEAEADYAFVGFLGAV